MWLDYKGKRHFLPTEMPEEPFIYGKYNRKRPHSYNNGLTPHAARMAAEKDITKCYKFA